MISIRRGESADVIACGDLLRTLSDWFGIESSIIAYETSLASDPFWVAESDDGFAGFIACKSHFDASAEITVMAVKPDLQRRHIGSDLVHHVENALSNDGIQFLQVKTLSPSRPDPYYSKTRLFYEALGFVPLEEFPTIWSPGNPALLYIKHLHA